jgi:ribosomal protein L28
MHKRGVAGGRWKKRAPKTPRTFKVNLQRFTAIADNVKMKVKLCSKCVKRIKKDIRDGQKPILQLIHLEKPTK